MDGGEKLESDRVKAYLSFPVSHKARSEQRLGVSHTISPRGGSSDGGFIFHKTKHALFCSSQDDELFMGTSLGMHPPGLESPLALTAAPS